MKEQTPRPKLSQREGKKGNGMKTSRHYRGGYQVAGLADRARELRVEQTSAELVLWKVLRNRGMLGFKFRRQHQFGDYLQIFIATMLG